MADSLQILSLGAGVQSSTMALMAAKGLFKAMPDAAIFADTQAEPEEVYTWLDWLEQQLPFPVIRVTKGNLAESATKVRTSKKSGNRYIETAIPAFLPNAGLLQRHCSADFKIAVILRESRRLMKEARVSHAYQWIGISMDEAQRMKPSQSPKFTNVWPLIDEIEMRRFDCISWMREHGYPDPPRSACVFCPYHSDKEWVRLKTDHPDDFQKAVSFEKKLQSAMREATAYDHETVFLHRDRKPLDQVNFEPQFNQPSLFGDECEGICGV